MPSLDPFEREKSRQSALDNLKLLDTPETESFDRITRMASQLFQVPMAAMSLSDRSRQWFKSYVGFSEREIPREIAPCSQVTRAEQRLVIPDLLENSNFADGLLAKSGIRFYAGAPLTTRDGYVLGSLCVLDCKPRSVSDAEMQSLQDFANLAVSQIELERNFGRIDPLSGLPNRYQFSEDLDNLQKQNPFAGRVAVLIDLTDPMKFSDSVNVLGTIYIDQLVKAGARIIKDELAGGQSTYHISTASFLTLVEEGTDEPWRKTVDRLLKPLSREIICDGIPVTIQPAFGIAPFRVGETAAHQVLRTAISAANDARAKDVVHAVYSLANDRANRRRFAILNDLRAALENSDQFALVYQPRIDVVTGICVSAEALLRWHNPSLGTIEPSEFIPLAEQTALAMSVTRWVLNKAISQAARWRRLAIDLRLSVNISARDLEEPGFVTGLQAILQGENVPPHAIELEFTESTLIRNRPRVFEHLDQIRSMGLGLAIDDFGSGYSAFSYLNRLPATTLKIDQSFISSLSQSALDLKLVRSMITMAHEIGYRVVAEGVETAEAFRLLADAGCDEIQGYFVSRPLPGEELEEWLKQRRDAGTIAALKLLATGSAVA